MSLGREFPKAVPENTAKAAKMSFKKKKNPYLVMGDSVSDLFATEDFQELYSKLGQHAINPVVMTLITLVQFIEGLSDREVMNILPGRLDLKYLFRLDLYHTGFDAANLAKFRARLLRGGVDKKIFDRILEVASKKGLLTKEKQRTDSTHMIAAVASLTRTELIIEGMRHLLDRLAQIEPDFVRGIVDNFLALNAYTQRGMNFRMPKKENLQKALAESVAKDAMFLLEEIDRELNHLKYEKPVVVLRRILGEQFDIDERGQPTQKKQEDLAKSQYLLGSPYDTDARYSTKRSESWLGFKLQVTETADSKLSPIITDIRVTSAPLSDSEMLLKIQSSLAMNDLAPDDHIVDMGYTGAEIIQRSEKKYKINVIGPIQEGTSWQSAANKGFSSSDFKVDWEDKIVICPAGKENQKWIERNDRKAIHVAFSAETCQRCPFKEDCTKAEKGGRVLELKTKDLAEFYDAHKKKTETKGYWKKYQLRAGIEGTISRITNEFGIRRCRYVGLRKAEFQAMLTGAAMNLVRIVESIMRLPKSETRVSPFVQLLKAS